MKPKIATTVINGKIIALYVQLRGGSDKVTTRPYPQPDGTQLFLDVDKDGFVVGVEVLYIGADLKDSNSPPEKDKLGKRTPEEITDVDASFDKWMGQPRSIIDSVRNIVRAAFHAGYHRGKDVGESEAVESARMGG